MTRETKVYLNTVEDFTKALKDNKIVYAMDEFCDGESKIELINDMLVRKDPDGEIIIDGNIIFIENVFYLKEKEPLKIEVGKFYKTREGDKAICLNKDKKVGNPSEYVYMIHCIGFPCHYWTDKNGKVEKYLQSGLDIVDYWED